MNCVQLLLAKSREEPNKLAIWMPDNNPLTFSELIQYSRNMQKALIKYHLKVGDSVLLFEPLSPYLYSAVCGFMALGIKVIFVEPWMPIADINHVIQICKPKLFLANWMGRCWGLRVANIRKIAHWSSLRTLLSENNSNPLTVENLETEQPGIITFTSGTTGKPKGIIRSHGYLTALSEILCKALDLNKFDGPDLCIFANFALLNLASGKSSLVIPAGWKKKHLLALNSLPSKIEPETMTCGPAFLEKLMNVNPVSSLKALHVGGALSDCSLWERAFGIWPEAEWSHIYGSSEAEPVCIAEGKKATQLSRERGFFQNIYLGHVAGNLKYKSDDSGLWVSGPQVSPLYLGNENENQLNKRLDEQGKLWHFMGDRVTEDSDGFWYAGRSSQVSGDFLLEQKIYTLCNTSRSFLLRNSSGQLILCGENIKSQRKTIENNFPEITKIVELKIYRDKRHLARIDRPKSIIKGARWLMKN